MDSYHRRHNPPPPYPTLILTPIAEEPNYTHLPSPTVKYETNFLFPPPMQSRTKPYHCLTPLYRKRLNLISNIIAAVVFGGLVLTIMVRDGFVSPPVQLNRLLVAPFGLFDNTVDRAVFERNWNERPEERERYLVMEEVSVTNNETNPALNFQLPTGTAEEDSRDIGVIHLLLSASHQLRELEKVVCGLKDYGHSLSVAVVHAAPSLESYDGNRRLAWENEQCTINYSVFGGVEEYYDALGASEDWLDEADVMMLGHGLQTAFISENEDETGRKGGRGIINLPKIGDGEENVWDWVGTLGITSLSHWNTPRIDLSVITNDRPASFSRLLSSLQNSHYLGDPVHLSVSLESTSTPLTHSIVSTLKWPYGMLTSRHRVVSQAGLMKAIIESWYPSDEHNYGVILEDDVEVSPMFYAWLKWTVLKYRYGSAMERDVGKRMFGISLYQQKATELRPEGRRPFDARATLNSTAPYLSQIPVSWGGLYFPEQWAEFHQYLNVRHSVPVALQKSTTIIPGVRSNKWNKSWKKFFIELNYLRGYSMLYPNYNGWLSLSTNHLELGSHVKKLDDPEKLREKKDLFTVPLVPDGSSLLEMGLPNGKLPDFRGLAVLDFWGEVVSGGVTEIEERGWERHSEMIRNTIVAGDEEAPCVSLGSKQSPRFDAQVLLCPMTEAARLAKQNKAALANAGKKEIVWKVKIGREY